MATLDTHRARVQALLRIDGWTPLGCVAIACKTFQTATTPKEALIFLSKGDAYNRRLYAQYYSEGRNCPEGCDVLLPLDCDEALFAERVASFARSVDKAVRESYAVRLLQEA